jgi:hypothetical protein
MNTTVTMYVVYVYTQKVWSKYLYVNNYTKFSPNKDLGLYVKDKSKI